MHNKHKPGISRRSFLKLGMLASAPIHLVEMAACRSGERGATDFEIVIQNSSENGHLLLNAQAWPENKIEKCETVIAGGGIAGLSAVASIKERDYMLFELEPDFGGTASSSSYHGMPYAQGAHYTLAFPDYYGEETLDLLQQLQVTEFNDVRKTWEFVDKGYLIRTNSDNVVVGSTQRRSVLPNLPQTHKLLSALDTYIGKMLMPVRSMSSELFELDAITFTHFLNKTIGAIHPDLKQAIDYQMYDDYGSSADNVSALAGIHYYTCRPYEQNYLELFSPPQGNYYFAEKLLKYLGKEKLFVNHLVSGIEKSKKGYRTVVLDIANRRKRIVESKKVIYAGKKHALKYIYPKAAPAYADLEYAPWVTINFALFNLLNKRGFWQNEWLDRAKGFLGFVDSDAQFHQSKPLRFFTVYYCLQPGERENLNSNFYLEQLTKEALQIINEYFQIDLSPLVAKAFVKPMGHAMAIPKTGFLTNKRYSEQDFAMAGVDNGRLPLLFEAMDSGIIAARNHGNP